MELVTLKRAQLAHDLIQAGLRLSVVRGMTHLGVRTLRQWWKDIYGAKPPNGKLPESVISFILNKEDAALLSAAVELHKRIHGKGMPLTAESLLQTWRECSSILGPLDINAIYFAVRDVRLGIVSLSRCTSCHAGYLYDRAVRHTERCPFCGEKVIN